jgi:2-hydroxycyclohexanecarboxyl-CoA dehydrogenase
MSLIDFTGKTVVVTGGARGIGRAIVHDFAKSGADVVIADYRAGEAEETAHEIGQVSGRKVLVVGTDVSHYKDVQKLSEETLHQFGKVDVLVNCAGWDRLMPFLKTTPELWDKVISINYRGVIHTCHAFLPIMVKQKYGSIVNIGSDTARVGSLGEAIYSSAKAAVIAFSKTLAREHARDNIRVNVVCPGLVDTPLLEEMKQDEFTGKILSSIVGFIPFKRLGRPEEIAPMVLFLASDGASYITGQVVSINGGLNMVS